MSSNTELEAQLLKEFCPPLDPAVCLAILLDYDVHNAKELEAARQTLLMLTESAALEEASGFDPSGSGGGYLASNDGDGADGSVSGRSRQELSSGTESTSISHGLSSRDLDSVSSTKWSETNDEEDAQRKSKLELEALSGDQQEAILISTFSNLKAIDIKMALRKHNGDASKAVEDLLLRVFLVENEYDYHGIDGFSETNGLVAPPRKGGKKKKKGRKWDKYSEPEWTDSSPAPSRWSKSAEDVEFISQKLKMPEKQVRSLYHQNGASLSSTIRYILDNHPENLDGDTLDPVMELEAHGLSQDFPSISPSLITTLIHITHPSTVAAREVAEALVSSNAGSNQRLLLNIHYNPVQLDDSSSSTVVRPYAHNAVHATPPPNLQQTRPQNTAQTELQSLQFRRNQVWDRIHTTMRQARSNDHFAGAAAYYSNEASTLTRRVRDLESSAADELVGAQSSHDHVDLHGVSVQDAVRITEQRLSEWWVLVRGHDVDGSGAHTGFRIITGLGRHSEGGRSKLSPAVRRLLQRGGWRFKEGEGFFQVVGREAGTGR